MLYSLQLHAERDLVYNPFLNSLIHIFFHTFLFLTINYLPLILSQSLYYLYLNFLFIPYLLISKSIPSTTKCSFISYMFINNIIYCTSNISYQMVYCNNFILSLSFV